MSSPSPIVLRRRAPRAAPLVAALTGALAVVLTPGPGLAQTAPAPGDTVRDSVPAPPAEAAECFGFAFGPWNPALNWRAGGHGADAPSVRLAGEFASRDSAGDGRELLLFPSWWPAGVGVRFVRPPRVLGDTVTGVAHAFVADGRLATPSATVRAWLKPCGGGARPR